MTEKSCEERWREYYAERARRWRSDPWFLVNDLESIMDSPCYTAREKLKLMKRAMEAYYNAVEEKSGR